MKKILIFYAAYGGGHFSAAKAIKKYLDDNYDVETELVDCIQYVSKILNRVTTGAYNQMAKNIPSLWGRIYANSQKGVFAHLSSRANKMMAVKLKNLINEKSPDIVVSTHPFSSQMVAYLRKKNKVNTKLVTVLTDFAPHDQWLIGHEYTDAFCVSNKKMENYLITYGIEKDKVHVTGIPLSDKFSKSFNKTEIYKELRLDESMPVILFFGGGEFGLGKDRTLQILRSLIHNLPTYQIVAVSGRNKKMNKGFNDIVKETNSENRVNVFDYTNKVPEIMSISTLVVTKPGGLTTSESLASGLPLLVINPIPGQEEENAEFLEKNNVGIWLRKKENPDKIIQELFMNKQNLEKMKENTIKLAKKDSTKDICNIIINLA